MPQIRTAVVGLGMGREHALAYKAAEGAELRWVVDLNEELAAKVAQEAGCSYTTDWKAILDDVDALSLCTPHHLHAPQTLYAIAAGKHVLVEKPMANTEQDCLAMIEAAESRGVTLMVGFSVRYRPAVKRLKEVIQNGEFGRPFNANCWIETRLPPQPGSWFSRKDQLGGGVLFSHGCHYIDILLWLLGAPKRVAHLGTRLGTEWMEGEGTAHSIIEFESGALGYLETSWGMRFSDQKALMHVHTPEALLVLDRGISRLDAVTAEGRKALYEPPAGERRGAVRDEIQHFLECVDTGNPPDTNGREALKSLRTIWSMYG